MIPKMGKIIARNMLSWLELLISRYCCIKLVVYIIYNSLYIFETCQTISIYSSTQCRVFHIVTFFLVRKIFTFYINEVLLFKCPFPGPKA